MTMQEFWNIVWPLVTYLFGLATYKYARTVKVQDLVKRCMAKQKGKKQSIAQWYENTQNVLEELGIRGVWS